MQERLRLIVGLGAALAAGAALVLPLAQAVKATILLGALALAVVLWLLT